MRSFMIRQRELESAVAERTAALEAERTLEHNQHRVLEMITSGSSLAQIFEGIKDLVRSRNNNLECFIHPGMPPIDVSAPGLIRRYIRASSSEPSGWIDFDVTLCNGQEDDPENTMSIALRLASIAIESANAQEKLTHQAYHDSLTGLPNRLQFQWSLDKATAEANTAGEDFALLYIDLDRFKQVNDRCGHRIGDLYLQELSNLFRSCIRKGDLLARLGGDEFAAILPGANGAAAERSVQAIRLALAKPLFIEEFQFHPSASIGFSLCPDNGMDAESLLHAADEAMYDAKVTGMMHSVDCLIESVKT
jgi:diguanylate cyclase (GGDEF)-like protein